MTEPTLADELERYLEWMYAMQYSTDTVRNRRSMLRDFVRWLHAHGVPAAGGVDEPTVIAYRATLRRRRSARGVPLTVGTQIQRLVAIAAFLRWLDHGAGAFEGVVGALRPPRKPHRIPRGVMSVATVRRVLESVATDTPLGVRDRALLELLYATGLRRAEDASLPIHRVDLSAAIVTVVSGKGRRDRLVPLTHRASRWIANYVRGARRALASYQSDDTMFVSWRGRPVRPKWVSERVGLYLRRAGVVGPGSAHMFRHAMATHLLDGGADITYIQQILGHARLSTTAAYAHVSLARLQRVYAQCHPLYD